MKCFELVSRAGKAWPEGKVNGIGQREVLEAAGLGAGARQD